MKISTKILTFKSVDRFLKQNYLLILFLIIAASIALRFYNFQYHLSFQADTTRDISIAKEALKRRELPLTGSFSSAGPFVFGPLFYWFLMLAYLIFSFTILSPWILTGVVNTILILGFAYLGKLLAGRTFSIILAILAATSPQLVLSSTSPTQHTFVVISTVLLLISLTLLWQKKKLIFSFLAGLALGAALSFHYQSLNLLLVTAIIIFIPSFSFKRKLLAFVLLFFGLLLILLPFLIWDGQHSWVNFRNLMDYLLIGQYRLYVPNSWRLFLLTYFPDYWSLIAGGMRLLALGLIFLISIFFSFLSIKKQIELPIFVYGLAFFLMTILNRYYRGERSAGYLYYLTPFVLLFTAWIVLKIMTMKLSKNVLFVTIGLVIVTIIVAGNFYIMLPKIIYKNTQFEEVKKTMGFLEKQHPNKKFLLYDYKSFNPNVSYSLSIFLEDKDKIQDDGVALGICTHCPENLRYITSHFGIEIFDLSGENLGETNSEWHKVSQETIYDSTIGWLKAGNLKSSFSLSKHLKEKFWPGH